MRCTVQLRLSEQLLYFLFLFSAGWAQRLLVSCGIFIGENKHSVVPRAQNYRENTLELQTNVPEDHHPYQGLFLLERAQKC